MSKDLFKQAIAEAKSVREAAIANAKEALEESLTPHLKDMLAAKLQEMETSEEVEEAKHDDKKDETIEEAPKEDDKHEAVEEIAEEVPAHLLKKTKKLRDDSEESEDEAPTKSRLKNQLMTYQTEMRIFQNYQLINSKI